MTVRLFQAKKKFLPLQLTLMLVLFLTTAIFSTLSAQTVPQPVIQFVFTSDPHYGITRDNFQGASKVDAHIVNAAMVAKMNALPVLKLPADGGINEGQTIGAIDFIAETGDIANRQEGAAEKHIQSAAESWNQFKADYIDGLTLKNRNNEKTPLYIVPGNHDVTDAIGFYKPMYPAKDATSIAAIYNLMMKPAVPKTKDTYNYATDKIHFSLNIDGIHFIFITMWPDSGERQWIEEDLQKVSADTPVILFTHDQPDVEAKHLMNPNGKHDINSTDQFEDLLTDQLADGKTVADPTTMEQKALETFLKNHPNITAYFHGNDNWHRFMDWTGPDHTVAIHKFVVDSPMKGNVSAKDETKLAFYLVTIDPQSRLMTVRDCLWNADPSKPSSPIAWGNTVTVALFPRPAIQTVK